MGVAECSSSSFQRTARVTPSTTKASLPTGTITDHRPCAGPCIISLNPHLTHERGDGSYGFGVGSDGNPGPAGSHEKTVSWLTGGKRTGVEWGSAGTTGWHPGWITVAMGMGQHWPGGSEPSSRLGGVTDWLSLQDHKEWVVGKEQSIKLTTPLPSFGSKGGKDRVCVYNREYRESALLRRKAYL